MDPLRIQKELGAGLEDFVNIDDHGPVHCLNERVKTILNQITLGWILSICGSQRDLCFFKELWEMKQGKRCLENCWQKMKNERCLCQAFNIKCQ